MKRFIYIPIILSFFWGIALANDDAPPVPGEMYQTNNVCYESSSFYEQYMFIVREAGHTKAIKYLGQLYGTLGTKCFMSPPWNPYRLPVEYKETLDGAEADYKNKCRRMELWKVITRSETKPPRVAYALVEQTCDPPTEKI